MENLYEISSFIIKNKIIMVSCAKKTVVKDFELMGSLCTKRSQKKKINNNNKKNKKATKARTNK